ncbi:hypothetical protein [Halorarius halobius]|uniref:hypothetical protein n=1 Tax=Halorarius halobius TaxID=2962671 RepID=UPI0020CD9247|nr:hypothetical protein [Halorarius halobius]
MVETHWDALRGREVRYRDHTWELTGDVTVRDSGTVVSLGAVQTDDVRRRSARLQFDVAGPSSLNPGSLGDVFERLERDGGTLTLVVETDGRRYRYRLTRLAYE